MAKKYILQLFFYFRINKYHFVCEVQQKFVLICVKLIFLKSDDSNYVT